MKRITILSVLVVFSTFVRAQQSEIAGTWLVTKVEKGNKIETPYLVFEFFKDGTMNLMGMQMATWNYDKQRNTLVLKSDFDKDFNGENKIMTLTNKELVLEKDGTNVYYKKLDLDKIQNANKNSGVLGLWEFAGNENPSVKNYIEFMAPDEYKIIQKGENRETRLKGTWIFNKNNSTLLLMGFGGEDVPVGKNDMVKMDHEGFQLSNNGVVFNLKKKNGGANSQEIHRLTFTQDDFFTEDGDYKYYEDEEKLPWKSLYESDMKQTLVNVHQLVYNKATLISGAKSFENKTLIANVTATPDDYIAVDNIFIGFDRFNLPDDSAFPPNTDYTNPLYPLEENTFRIVGNEQLTTPAGTFDCTVLEVLGDRDVNKKVWMVNDTFGMYAKIIEDDPDETFGHYYIYELQEIK